MLVLADCYVLSILYHFKTAFLNIFLIMMVKHKSKNCNKDGILTFILSWETQLPINY